MYRTAAILTIVADHLLVAWYAWRGFSQPWTWWQLLVGLVAGHLLLDGVTLVVHWILDNYFAPTTPVLGTVIGYFREHHVDQLAMFQRDYFENNFENALLGTVTLAALLPVHFSPLPSFMLAFAALGSAYVTLIHKWAHGSDTPGVIRLLQRAKVLVDQDFHDGHHRDASRHYGLYAGWLDRLLDALRLFELAELSLFVLFGAVAVETRLHLAAPGELHGLRARLRRAGWRTWYALFAAYTRRRGAEFSCMNWGYADEGEDGDGALADEPERYPKQLYEAVSAATPLAGSTVVDVSCGRGGGLAHLHARHAPARAIGIDLVPGNVSLCRSAFCADGLSFRQGSAEAIPLRDGEADVVLSVEASHCYGDLARFLDEARRVLRPGGELLWTDFAPAADLPRRRALVQPRFEVVEERDITDNVLRAMRLDARRRVELIKEHASPLFHGLLRHFAAAGEEERSYQDFATGRDRYFLFRLRRTAETRPASRDRAEAA